MLGSKIANAPENDGFAVIFVHLEGRRGSKEDSRRWGKARQDRMTGPLTRFRALPKVAVGYSNSALTQMHRNDGQGWPEALRGSRSDRPVRSLPQTPSFHPRGRGGARV